MKILVLGNRGQLGLELCDQLQQQHNVIGVDREEVDICDQQAIASLLERLNPGLIINAAAYTAVDRAEHEKDLCFAINAQAPIAIAKQASERNIGFIHYSTDYVFDGRLGRPYTESDKANPLGNYGLSKWQADEALLAMQSAAWIFRTSWVYGPRGHNFYLTMKKLICEKPVLNVVDDQTGAPTSVIVLASLTAACIANYENNKNGRDFVSYMSDSAGLYHLSCKGETTWFGFARAIAERLEQAGNRIAQINPISTEQYPVDAARPQYSVLDSSHFESVFGLTVPDWQDTFAAVWERNRESCT